MAYKSCSSSAAVLAAILFCGSAWAQSPGALNLAFDAALSPGAQINGAALQPDGKLVIAGSFTPRGRHETLTLLRLEQDGMVDRSFPLYGFAQPDLLATAPDGKVLVSGWFGLTNLMIVRLTPEGTVDPTFQVRGVTNTFGSTTTQGTAMAVDADGKVLFGGYYVIGNGSRGVVRLNSDGSLDATFCQGSGVEFFSSIGPDANSVSALAVQADGNVLVTGIFTAFNGVHRASIARIKHDGTLDQAFDPGDQLWAAHGADPATGAISAVALGPAGQIYVALYSARSGSLRSTVFRLHADGALDPNFPPPGCTNGVVSRLAIDQNGLVIATGSFSQFGGVERNGVVRLKSDGSVDPTFAPASSLRFTPQFNPASVFVRPDGGILVAGAAASVEGTDRNGVLLLRGKAAAVAAPTLTRSPAGVNASEGAEVQLEGAVSTAAVPAPAYQWSLEGQSIPGATNRQLLLHQVRLDQAGRYRVTVSNSAGSVTSDEAVVKVLAAMAHPGAMDLQFQPEEAADAASIWVASLAPIPGGGAYAARYVQHFDGGRSNEILRFSASGKVDPKFHVNYQIPGNIDPLPLKIALQSDGKLLVLNRLAVTNVSDPPILARFGQDGSIDSTFAPAFSGTRVYLGSLAIQPDGKILVVGHFSAVNGTARTNVVRLLQDGSVDATFDANAAVSAPFAFSYSGVVILSNGQIILSPMTRLNADGTLDTSFEQGIFSGSIATQSTGALILALGNGTISTMGITNYGLARINSSGRLDGHFKAAPDAGVTAVAVASDDKIYAGGSFQYIAPLARSGLARLNVDGTADPSFDPGTGLSESPMGSISTAMLTEDGRLWIAGNFDQFNGYRRPAIALLQVQDVLRLGMPRIQDQRVSLAGLTEPGRIYHLQSRASLQDNWREVQQIVGDGTNQAFQDPEPIGSTRFYRVQIAPNQ